MKGESSVPTVKPGGVVLWGSFSVWKNWVLVVTVSSNVTIQNVCCSFALLEVVKN